MLLGCKIQETRQTQQPKTSIVWALSILSIFTIVLGMGCSLFSPLASSEKADMSYEALVQHGHQAIRSKQYQLAQEYFEEAIDKNPSGSEAWMFHGKAILYRYKVDYNRIKIEFDSKKGVDGKKGNNGLPFMNDSTTIDKIDSIYFPISTAVDDWEHILRYSNKVRKLGNFSMPADGDTASDGRVGEDVATLDLGLLQAVKAMLAPMDMDGNSRIDDSCGNKKRFGKSIGLDSYALKSKCKNDVGSEKSRFESFKKLSNSINIDSLSSKDIDAKDISNNPNDINNFLDAMEGPIAGASANLDSVNNTINTEEANKKPEDRLNAKLQDVIGSVKDLNYFLSYMRYNDQTDNDRDHFDTTSNSGGKSSEGGMVWIDFDRDNHIRWDYNENLMGMPNEYGNIGHPWHRKNHPELYVTMADYKKANPFFAKDTLKDGSLNKNSRLQQMIKACREILVLDSTCEKITPVLKSNVPRPTNSEWRSGPFGVDEEPIDDVDNDYDGLKDEDGRNAIGMDDDNDMIYENKGKVAVLKTMEWNDANANNCVDFNKNVKMDSLNPRKHCIGFLENKLMYAKDSATVISARYSIIVSENITENKDYKSCLDEVKQLIKLHPIPFKDIYTDAQINNACSHKHIWIAPRPANSEWTSGILGIDEEKPDGFDNDGDGWVDEDVSK